MELIKIQCPNCGADVDASKSGPSRCKHCGTGFYAEREDEKVVINTTINNYNTSGLNRNTSPNPVAVILGVFAVVVIGIVMMGIMAGSLFGIFGTGRNLQEINDVVYRSSVESVVMQKFTELVFAKNIDEVSEEDYASIRRIAYKGNSYDNISDDIWNFEYSFDDGIVRNINIPKELITDDSIEIEDFQAFVNLESLDLGGMSNIVRNYDEEGAGHDLSNLKNLHSFSSDAYMGVSALEHLFYNPENITHLDVAFYDRYSDVESFVSKFKNLESLAINYMHDDADENDFSHLVKLEKLTSYTAPMLRNNSYISSIKGLKELKIKGKEGYNDYSVLYAMPQLESLYLIDADELKDIDFVKNMSALKKLYISESQITGIEAISDLNLEELSLINNEELKDYKPILSNKGLAKLRLLSLSTLPEMPDFAELSALKSLYTEHYLIDKFSANSSIEELTLYIDLLDIINMEQISHMQALSKLSCIGDGGIQNVAALANLPSLKEIELHSVLVEGDISPIFNLTSLERLSISDEADFEVIPANIAGSPSLKELHIREAAYLYDVSTEDRKDIKIGDFTSQLSNFPNLENLMIRSQQIEDLSFVSAMPNLKTLDVSDNYIKDVSALAGLNSLKLLLCPNNSVANESLISDKVCVIK